MKCKDCNDVTCKHRSTDAEKDCVFVETVKIDNCYETVKNCGLRFDGGRIFKVEEHQKPDRYPYEVKVDVTEEILDVFLKILDKRKEESYQNAMVEQLKNSAATIDMAEDIERMLRGKEDL